MGVPWHVSYSSSRVGSSSGRLPGLGSWPAMCIYCSSGVGSSSSRSPGLSSCPGMSIYSLSGVGSSSGMPPGLGSCPGVSIYSSAGLGSCPGMSIYAWAGLCWSWQLLTDLPLPQIELALAVPETTREEAVMNACGSGMKWLSVNL